MELYITRHGQTRGNIEHFFQGQMEGELTPVGCEQAKKFGNFYRNLTFDEIYCSDLLRAKKTLEIILEQNLHEENKKLIKYTQVLREINGKSIEYKPLSVESKLRNNPSGRFRFNSTGEGDETMIDLFYRMSQFIDELIRKNISKDYSSGITKENVYKLNEEANNISYDDFINLWKQGKLTNNTNWDDEIKVKKIFILCHWGPIFEIFNNILLRTRKCVVPVRAGTSNTSLNIIRIYPKEKNICVKSDEDIIYSIRTLDDITHLNK